MQTPRIEAAATQRLSLRAALPVEFTAAATADGGDGEPMKRPTFSISGYTGAPMYVSGFYSPVILDLAGMKAASQEIPVLWDHDPTRIVGMTDSVKIAAKGVSMTGIVTGENDHAEEIVTQARNGFKWQASVGAGIDRREFLDSGKTAQVNGRTVSGPMVIARESTLYEISFVAIGADGATSANVAASQTLGSQKGAHDMFEQWLQAKGFDPAALSDQQKASLKAAYDSEHPPKPEGDAGRGVSGTKPADSFEALMQAKRAELARQESIKSIAARWMDDRPGQLDEIERITKAAMESSGTDPDKFELALTRELRPQTITVVAGRGHDQRFGPKVVEAAICQAARLPTLDEEYDDRTLQAARDRFKHGIGLSEILIMAARENGYTGYSASDLRGLLKCAFQPAIRANAGFSTLDISGILSNVANKFVRPAFEAVESGWREITSVRNLRDFKAHTTYSLTGDMMYKKVGAGGEIEHGTLGEQSYTLRADTYARSLAITRQDLVNDDLGALTRVPTRLGRGAALKINDVFWTEFLADAGTFWTTGRANYFEGGSTNLQSSSLKSATEKFRKQTDPDGKPLGVMPRILLVPPELEIAADELMTSAMVNTGGSSTTDKVPSANVWRSKYNVVMSTYLSNSSYTGYSATAWYLLADPRDLPAIEVGFLNGRDLPVIESADADFDTLGIQMRGYHDFGVAKQEYRAGVKSKGAA